MSRINYLYELGLTNRDTEDLGCLITKNTRIQAYCTSDKCTQRKKEKVYKQISNRDTVFCLDCGNALLWKDVYEHETN